MTDNRDPESLADQAAEAIRAINHATASPKAEGGYVYPAELYSVVMTLSHMASMLPQLLQQASRWLEHQDEHDRLRVDNGNSMQCSIVVGGALADLDDAVRLASMLNGVLERAGQHLSRVGTK